MRFWNDYQTPSGPLYLALVFQAVALCTLVFIAANAATPSGPMAIVVVTTGGTAGLIIRSLLEQRKAQPLTR